MAPAALAPPATLEPVAPVAPEAPVHRTGAPVAPAHRTAPGAPDELNEPHAPDRSGRSRLEALLRARKLDRTLTTAIPARPGEHAVASFDLPALDQRLLGGLPRGHVSEIVGGVSSGRTSLAWAWLAAATRRGETVALVDTFDRFDPASAAAAGIALSQLLWVRGQALSKTAGAVDPAWLPGSRAVDGPGTLLERTIDRALKALNLVLQAGVCTAVVLDVADVPLAGLRRIPMTTWLRLQRVIEGSDTACVLLAPIPLARSAVGVTITTGPPLRSSDRVGEVSSKRASVSVRSEADPPPRSSDRCGEVSPPLAGVAGRAEGDAAGASEAKSPGAVSTHAAAVRGAVQWAGAHDRSRRVAGVRIAARLSSPRRTVTGEVSIQAASRCEFGPVAVHW